jgi:hypothetical protein
MSYESIISHPDTEAIAAYLSDGLSPAERQALEAHLAECGDCRGELVGARRLLGLRRAERRRRVVLPAAAAAAIAAIVLLAPVREGRRSEHRLRDIPVGRPAIAVIAPAEGSEVDPAGLRFVWRRYGTASLYRLTVTNVSGQQVWVGETSDTVLAIPGGVNLEPDREYLWYVDALDLDGHSASSGIRHLRAKQ